MESRLTTYLKLTLQDYRAAGFTDADVASFGGLMKLQGYLHMLAAEELAPEYNNDVNRAKEAVRQFANECAKKGDNNFVYS